MAQKRIITQKESQRRTAEKLRMDLEFLPQNSGERGRKQAELAQVKSTLAASA